MPWFPIKLQTILSDSMAPSLHTGDLLFVKSNLRNLKLGAVVSFTYGNQLITHRIVGVNSDGSIITKGDNNDTIDPWNIPASSVVGSPFIRIPYFGFFLMFLRHPVGWITLIIIPGIVILVVEVKNYIKKRRSLPLSS